MSVFLHAFNTLEHFVSFVRMSKKRSRQPPAHLKDYAHIEDKGSTSKYREWCRTDCMNCIYLLIVDTSTYKIVLDSNDKEYVVTLKELEVEGLPAAEDDLDIGAKVVWMHKGRTGYAAEVIELPDHCEPRVFVIV